MTIYCFIPPVFWGKWHHPKHTHAIRLFSHLIRHYVRHDQEEVPEAKYKTHKLLESCLCGTNIPQFSAFYEGRRLFNTLPIDITAYPSAASFRKKLEKSILDKH